jgi:hypothetical protein
MPLVHKNLHSFHTHIRYLNLFTCNHFQSGHDNPELMIPTLFPYYSIPKLGNAIQHLCNCSYAYISISTFVIFPQLIKIVLKLHHLFWFFTWYLTFWHAFWVYPCSHQFQTSPFAQLKWATASSLQNITTYIHIFQAPDKETLDVMVTGQESDPSAGSGRQGWHMHPKSWPIFSPGEKKFSATPSTIPF